MHFLCFGADLGMMGIFMLWLISIVFGVAPNRSIWGCFGIQLSWLDLNEDFALSLCQMSWNGKVIFSKGKEWIAPGS